MITGIQSVKRLTAGISLQGLQIVLNAGDEDCYLVKTDSAGFVLWSKTFGGIMADRARNLQLTSDGGYILAGWTYTFGINNPDIYILKTDANGDTLWTRGLGGTSRIKPAPLCKLQMEVIYFAADQAVSVWAVMTFI
jgi:hypothetical protein